MADNPIPANPVYWPRVKQILDGIMGRWTQRRSREPYPGIHEYYWDSPEDLAKCAPLGRRLIEPGVPGRQTQLVLALTRGVASTGRMPLGGPFLSAEEVDEIVAWIDAGMPVGPQD